MTEFKNNIEDLDDRSLFANRICKLLIDKNNGSIDLALLEFEPIYEDLLSFIRNIYELIHDEIPLMALYELKTQGSECWEFTEDEHQERIVSTFRACEIYYLENNLS